MNRSLLSIAHDPRLATEQGVRVLPVWDVVRGEEAHRKQGLPLPPSGRFLYVGTGRPVADISVGATFDLSFSSADPNQPEDTLMIVHSISVQRGRTVEILPSGYSAMCLVEFGTKIPDSINLLPDFGERSRGSVLFTTRHGYEVMRLIAETGFATRRPSVHNEKEIIEQARIVMAQIGWDYNTGIEIHAILNDDDNGALTLGALTWTVVFEFEAVMELERDKQIFLEMDDASGDPLTIQHFQMLKRFVRRHEQWVLAPF